MSEYQIIPTDRRSSTLHILSNPHGITNPKYRMEPFNIAVHKFIENMKNRGYDLVHYGHESSDVDCEQVICVTNQELPPPNENALFLEKPEIQAMANKRASAEIARRKKAGDIALCWYGIANQGAVFDHSNDIIVAEPSIGYTPSCVFAPYRAFVSYSQMHYYYGMHNMMLNPSWYDAVIPNAFTVSEFEFNDTPQDYFVYLGRITKDKGIDLAIQTTQTLGKRLIIAGPGDLTGLGYTSVPKHVELVGYVNAVQRKNLLKNAVCLMAPTYYLEPFGNIVAEAQFCGTPVITTDWGGFVDSVVPGVTGYRCKDFKTLLEAANTVHLLNRKNCREWAEQQFSDEVVHNQFDDWLQKIIRNNFYYLPQGFNA